MKNILNCKALLVLLILNIPQLPAQTNQEKLIGNWAFDYETTIDNLNEEAKARYNNMDVGRKDRLVQSYDGRQINFGAGDGTLLRYPDGKEVFGTWSLGADEKTIHMTNAQNGTVQYTIKEITDTNLVLKLTGRGQGHGRYLFSEWYFIKN